MAKFPIQRGGGISQGGAGASGRSVLRYDTRTGAETLGRSIQESGRELQRLGEIIYKKQRDNQIAEYNNKAKDKVSQMFIAMDAEQDETKYQKMWEDTFDKIRQEEPSNPQARDAYRETLMGIRRGVSEQVINRVKRRVNDKHDAVMDSWKADALQTGNMQKFEDRLNTFVANGTLSEKRRNAIVAEMKPRVEKAAEANTKEVLLTAGFDVAREKGLPAAAELIKSSNLSNRDKSRIYNTIENEILYADWMNEVKATKAIADGQVTYTQIDKYPNLTDEKKEKYKLLLDGKNDTNVVTDNRAWMINYEQLLNQWSGDSDVAATSNQLASARCDYKTIDDKDYSSLSKMAEKKYDPNIVQGLKTVYGALKKQAGLWISDKEARKNRDIMLAVNAWVDAQIEKGKQPTPEEMYIESRKYGVGETTPTTPVKDYGFQKPEPKEKEEKKKATPAPRMDVRVDSFAGGM